MVLMTALQRLPDENLPANVPVLPTSSRAEQAYGGRM